MMNSRIKVHIYTDEGTTPINSLVIESHDFNQIELSELTAEHILLGFKNSNGSRAHLQFHDFPASLMVIK
jgi:hypothetical protein